MTHDNDATLPNAMTAYVLDGGFSIDHVKPVRRPVLKPGPGQALVRVRATSLNYRDLMLVRGTYNPKLKTPIVLLSDGAGDVAAIGDGVERVAVGDRVAAIFRQGWLAGRPPDEARPTALGGDIDGMLAEYVVLHENGLVKIPEHLSYDEAATLPCAAVTAWNGLFEQDRIKPGDTVLVQGTGGVSIFVLQLAKLAGARVLITSSSDEKLARARELGADATLNYRTTPQWAKWAVEQTGGRGVDHVVEVGGPGTFEQSLRAVRRDGAISVIGVLTGTAGPVSTSAIIGRAARIHGVFVGSRAMFEDLNTAVAVNRLRPVIDRTFKAEQIGEALRYMESGGHFGKIVVTL